MTAQPLINFDPAGLPAIVNYTVPEAVAYDGVNIIELDIDPSKFNEPPIKPLSETDIRALTDTDVEKAMAEGFQDVRMFPDLGVPPGFLVYARKVTQPDGSQVDYNGCYLAKYGPFESEKWLTQELRSLSPSDVRQQLQAGGNLAIVRLTDHRYTYRFVDVDPRSPVRYRQRIALIESYRLSSYLGTYGAGRVVSTFSLLPGEKARINVKTYKRTTESSRTASTILDSLNDSSASDFEATVQDERSDKSTQARMDSWHVEAELTGSWGSGSASLSAGYKGSSSSAREQFARSVSNSVDKHVAQASSKRDVKVEQTTETTSQAGDESITERELRNINAGHTLNFVFRQLNQEYYSLLHLIDMRVGYTDGVTTKVVALHALDDLLSEFIKEEKAPDGAPIPAANQFRAKLKQAIIDDLGAVFGHDGKSYDILERVERKDAAGNAIGNYLRFKKGLTTTYTNPVTKASFSVDGILVAVTENVMRTDGIISEALLGQAVGLDQYGQDLQRETVRELKAKNDRLEQEVLRETAVQAAIKNKNQKAVGMLRQLYPGPTITTTTTITAPVVATPPTPVVPPAGR